jgi:hypothetical protein
MAQFICEFFTNGERIHSSIAFYSLQENSLGCIFELNQEVSFEEIYLKVYSGHDGLYFNLSAENSLDVKK